MELRIYANAIYFAVLFCELFDNDVSQAKRLSEKVSFNFPNEISVFNSLQLRVSITTDESYTSSFWLLFIYLSA